MNKVSACGVEAASKKNGRAIISLLALIMAVVMVISGCAQTPAAPVEPSEPAAPAEPVQGEEPAAPAQSEEPVTPAQSEEPAKQIEEWLPLMEDEALLERIDEQCRTFFEIKELTGMSVGVLADGHIAYFNYGMTREGGEEVDENTIYEIASLTKTFTGTLLALYANDGAVELDQPVQDFFDFPVPNYRGTLNMTLRNLATHSSGLPRMPINFPDSSTAFADYNEEMLLEYLSEGLLRNEPGTTYEYSNLGMGLLGYILGKVAERPYDEILTERILAPIGMDSTAIYLNEEQQSRKAGAHLESGTPAHEWDFDVMQACGGLKSSTHDMLRYLAANMLEIDVTPELSDAMGLAHRIHFSGGAQVGLGWHDANYSGVRALAHDGLVGGYCSFNAFSKSEDVAVVILCNNSSSVTMLGADLMVSLSRAKSN